MICITVHDGTAPHGAALPTVSHFPHMGLTVPTEVSEVVVMDLVFIYLLLDDDKND